MKFVSITRPAGDVGNLLRYQIKIDNSRVLPTRYILIILVATPGGEVLKKKLKGTVTRKSVKDVILDVETALKGYYMVTFSLYFGWEPRFTVMNLRDQFTDEFVAKGAGVVSGYNFQSSLEGKNSASQEILGVSTSPDPPIASNANYTVFVSVHNLKNVDINSEVIATIKRPNGEVYSIEPVKFLLKAGGTITGNKLFKASSFAQLGNKTSGTDIIDIGIRSDGKIDDAFTMNVAVNAANEGSTPPGVNPFVIPTSSPAGGHISIAQLPNLKPMVLQRGHMLAVSPQSTLKTPPEVSTALEFGRKGTTKNVQKQG